ncbi:MAG: ArsR family transcriptional regulator [Anaerolineae bacterium]
MTTSMPYLIVPCQAVPDLPDHLRVTYALILGLAWGASGNATPPVTIRELAELRGLSPRAIDAHLAALRRAGYVENAPQRDGLPLVLIPRPLPGVSALPPAPQDAPPAQGETAERAGGSTNRSSLPPLNLDQDNSSYSLLVHAGVYPSVAITLAQRPWMTPELVRAWAEHLRTTKGVRHLGGLLASILRRGDIGMPPPPLDDDEDDDEPEPDPAPLRARRDPPAPDLADLGRSWSEVLDELIGRLPGAHLDAWLADSQPLAWDGRILTIATHSWLSADYLMKRNTTALDQVLREFTGRVLMLRFVYKG